MITGTIVFEHKPSISNNEEYWYSDIEENVEYNIIDSYEKQFSDGKSKHFFLIQHEHGPLIEIPLSNYFKFISYK